MICLSPLCSPRRWRSGVRHIIDDIRGCADSVGEAFAESRGATEGAPLEARWPAGRSARAAAHGRGGAHGPSGRAKKRGAPCPSSAGPPARRARRRWLGTDRAFRSFILPDTSSIWASRRPTSAVFSSVSRSRTLWAGSGGEWGAAEDRGGPNSLLGLASPVHPAGSRLRKPRRRLSAAVG